MALNPERSDKWMRVSVLVFEDNWMRVSVLVFKLDPLCLYSTIVTCV